MKSEQVMMGSNFILNVINGLSKKNNKPLETFPPELLAILILAEVPKHRIKKLIVKEFDT